LYTAAEIYTGQYINAVNSWAMGVVSFQFVKGLPTHTKGLNTETGSREIHQKIDALDSSQPELVVQLLKRMLKLRPEDRPSARSVYQTHGSEAHPEDEYQHGKLRILQLIVAEDCRSVWGSYSSSVTLPII